jgi:N-acetylneuraminate synthase
MTAQHVYVIAEAGVNHNGSLDLARTLVKAAASGADAVKFQTFKADRLVSRSAPKAPYQVKTTGGAETQHEMIRKLELDPEAHRVLIKFYAACGVAFLSTPFDLESVGLLAGTFDLPLLKVSSGDITNAPLLLARARTGKPVILSTGMSTLGEVEDALGVLAFGYLDPAGEPGRAVFRAAYHSGAGQQALQGRVTLLHCTTEYPAAFADVNLGCLDTLRSAFGLPVGYSDHTEGIAVPIAAAALGASVIEKHFTLDRTLPGPDHRASLEPDQLAEMVHAVRCVEKALGSGRKGPAAGELENLALARKSLVAARAIGRGETFSAGNLTVKRPGSGLSPMRYWETLGSRAARDFAPDEEIVL